MNPSKNTCYEKELLELIRKLKAENRPIALFGTQHIGVIAKAVLSLFNIHPDCFVDNFGPIQGKAVEGITVLSPIKLKEKYPDAYICVCSFRKNNQIAIKNQLNELGFTDFIKLELMIYAFYTRIADRKNQIDRIMSSYGNLFETESGSSLNINSMNLIITEKCSLRCRDCSYLIPYYKMPTDYPLDEIFEGLDRFTESVDVIGRLSILGGEPLMHTGLKEIMEKVSSKGNIITAEIVTNGTIMPGKEILEAIKKHGICVSISNYGVNSPKAAQIKKAADEMGIICSIKLDNTWYDSGAPKPRNRKKEDNKTYFENCSARSICSSLQKGEYHLCPRSAHGIALGLIPKKESDFINVTDYTLTHEQLKEKLKNYIFNPPCLTACDYCGPFDITKPAQLLPAAVQID